MTKRLQQTHALTHSHTHTQIRTHTHVIGQAHSYRQNLADLPNDKTKRNKYALENDLQGCTF